MKDFKEMTTRIIKAVPKKAYFTESFSYDGK